MRRIQFLLIGALVATSFAGCKDDEVDPKPTPVDCSKPENADHKDCQEEPKECTEDFKLPAADATDLCTSEADIAAYAAAKDTLAATAQSQAIGCGATSAETAEDLEDVLVCTSCGVSEEAGVSPGCASCISQVVACAIQNCLDNGACPGDECEACREEHGCDAKLDECTGLGAPADIDCEDAANADHDDCKVDCEDPDNADHADCQDPV